MAEKQFQRTVANDLREMGCYVLVVTVQAGIPTGCPDVVALAPNGRWYTFECKDNEKSPFRPLQKPTIEKLNNMGYSRAVWPAIWEEVKCEIADSL